jgi:ferredoxin-thioredoxin reductase catalytic subunit
MPIENTNPTTVELDGELYPILKHPRIEEAVKKYALNDNGAKVIKIIMGLEMNFKRFGKTYCPCKIQKTDDNICPCIDYTTTSKCICGLFK